MRNAVKTLGVLGAAAIVLAACGSNSTSPPSTGSTGGGTSSSTSGGSGTTSSSSATGSTGTTAKFQACMVTDTGGIDDRSFNASSWQGVQEAENANITGTYLQSATGAAYVPNINAFIQKKCGIIITVGFLMGTDTQTAAKKNPNQKFAIVDYAPPPSYPNLDYLVFDTAQDAFLGGYLAAAMSKTGVVATFGGEQFPTVTIYMDGFWDGVQYFNQKNHKNVQVLGWNETTQKGSFTGDFTNQSKGETLTSTFISEKADVIFPVAGNVGLGAAAAVQKADQSGGSVNMEWVDTDGCISAPQYCKYFITSVEKGIQSAVKASIVAAAGGTFKGGVYIGDLANGGAALAPFHDFASVVPQSVQTELATIAKGIENGSIVTATKGAVCTQPTQPAQKGLPVCPTS